MASLNGPAKPIEKKRKPEQPLDDLASTPEDARASVPRTVIDGLLAASEARIQASVAAASAASLNAIKTLADTQQTSIAAEFGATLKGYDEQVCEKFDEVNGKIEAMAARLSALEDSSSSQVARVATIAKELVIMEKTKTIAEVQQQSSFDRDLDGTILRVDTHQKTEMALASISAAVTAWMGEANLSPEKFEVLGPRLGSNFVVKFSGERQLATKRAASAMGALRKQNGEWLDLRAVDADDKQIRLYVNTDKNGRMVRLEREGKKLQRAIQEGSPNAKVVFLRRDAVISFNFKAIAKIEVSPDGPTKLLWNEKALADSGVDRAEVTKKFTTNASEPVWTQHCL
jgi:hypothetical protein